jgi:hypothetical protein
MKYYKVFNTDTGSWLDYSYDGCRYELEDRPKEVRVPRRIRFESEPKCEKCTDYFVNSVERPEKPYIRRCFSRYNYSHTRVSDTLTREITDVYMSRRGRRLERKRKSVDLFKGITIF